MGQQIGLGSYAAQRRLTYLSVGQTNHAFHATVYIIEIMHKAIMAHEHIYKYKYNTIQDSEIHRTQHSFNTMTSISYQVLGDT